MSIDNDDAELSYRRGYTHGAWDVIQAIRGQISAAEYARLEVWFNKDVQEWRLKAMRGESSRDPSGMITGEIVPPRHLLQST